MLLAHTRTLLVFGALICTCGSAYAAGPLAIQGAKIITISSDPIENGTILIRDGKIAAVGTEIDIPGEAHVIDAEGLVIMPGFVDAHNAAGMSQANEQNSVVPFLSVVDSIDPIADYFEECRRNGITTAAVVPGNSTLIGGKAAIVKTAGQYVDDMIVKRDSALKLSMRPTSGSRMTHRARLRKELDKARKALEKESEDQKADDKKENEVAEKKSEEKAGEGDEGDKKEADGEKSAPEKSTAEDEGLAALKLAVKGEMPVYVYCEVAMDVSAALQLVDEYELDPILVLGRDCHKAAELLADTDLTVILDPTLVFWEEDRATRSDVQRILPKIYSEAEVPFIFQIENSASRRTLGNSYFWYQAATAEKYGLDHDSALAALTVAPAKLLGIDDSVGTIEEGKDADLILLSGEPLDITTWVDKTIVDGEVVYDRSQDEKLKRLLSPSVE